MEQDDNAYQANNEYFTFLGNDGKAFWQVPVMESTCLDVLQGLQSFAFFSPTFIRIPLLNGR